MATRVRPPPPDRGRQTDAGATLIEILVALAIFALIGTAGFSVLDQIVKVQDHTEARLADRGYFKIEDIEACEAAGIVPYVPKPLRGSAVANGFFGKDQFRYEAEADTYTCPGGAALRRTYGRPVRDGVRLFDYANAAACKLCALRTRCTEAAFERSPDTRTKPCWTGWLNVSPRGPRSLTDVARVSSTPSGP